MKIEYDEATDTLTVLLRDGAVVVDSDEGRRGFVLDYDAAGELVSLEILDASSRVTDARKVDFSMAG